MEKMAISKFKATCLAVVKRVQRTRKPVLLTKFGEPVAQVIPPPPKRRPKRWLGDLAHEGPIPGDIVSPATEESDWDALRK